MSPVGNVSTPTPAPEPEKNFGLSPEEFAASVVSLRQGDESVMEKIYLTQFEHCRDKLIAYDGLSVDQAYEATMEAVLYFRDLLLRDKVRYGNLRYLFVTIARQQWRRKNKHQAKLTALTAQFDLAEEDDEVRFSEAEYIKLQTAFRQMSVACRELLQRFYFQRQSLKFIAEDTERDYTNLRQQKSRCVKRLRNLCATSMTI